MLVVFMVWNWVCYSKETT